MNIKLTDKNLCKICDSPVDIFDKGMVLQKYHVTYFKCSKCGYIQTEEPFWLEEAYANQANITDTGVLKRNICNAKITATILFFLYNRKASYLDFAGGYGTFTRLMRDIGFDFLWYDPHSQNLFAKGFEYEKEKRPIELITAFECFEHFVDPISELANMINLTNNVLFTTELLPTSNPKTGEWWYYGLDHGQHIGLFTNKAISRLAEKFNLKLVSYKSFHLLTHKNISQYFFRNLINLSVLLTPLIVCKTLRSLTNKDMLLITGRDKRKW